MKTVTSGSISPRPGPADAIVLHAQNPRPAAAGGRAPLRAVPAGLTLCALLLALSLTSLPAQQYSVNWFKIAGGGGDAQGGGYTLRGTIGQWDAGRMDGGGFTVFGGFWAATYAGTFTPGNLVVQGVGEGLPGLGNYGQVAWLQEITTNGALAHTLYLPTNYPRPSGAPFNLMEEGAQITDGYPTRSADGQWICISGYNGTNHESLLASSQVSTVLRVIGLLGPDGTLDTSRAAAIYNGLNLFSVASQDGSGFWGVGKSSIGTLSGLVYFQPGVATNAVTNALFRCVRIVNNQLYVSTQPGGGLPGGIYKVGTGLPTTGTAPLTQLFPLAGSPFQFELNPGLTIAYVADDGTLGNGGIKKYTYNGAAWLSNYTLTISGAGTAGARGLVVDWSGANPVIYAATAESSAANRIVRLADTGPGAASVTVRTAPAYTAYRGLTWAPARFVPPTIIAARPLGNGSFEITFVGTTSQPYRVLTSGDATAPVEAWATIATGMFGAGPATFADPGAAGQPIRFYRIASP